MKRFIIIIGLFLITSLTSCTDSSNSTANSGSCCKICSTGKACGNTCISRSYTCNTPQGCACNSAKIDVAFSDNNNLPLVGVSKITAGMKDIMYSSGSEHGEVGAGGDFTYELGYDSDFYYQGQKFMTLTPDEIILEE